jgi:acyl carrier protein
MTLTSRKVGMETEIRQILVTHSRIPCALTGVSDHADLFAAGMTSHANVNVMLALEEAFDIEFPEAMLRRSTFASIAAIRDAISELTAIRAAS